MYIIAKLVFESYIPDELVPGIYFKQRIKDVIYGKTYEYDRIFMLNHKPNDRESYIITNGFPVKPTIVSLTANPDESAAVLATDPEIGWWDAQPWNDESDLRDIEIQDFNYILQEDDGYVEIEVESFTSTDDLDEDIIKPVLYMGKCTLRIVQDELYDDYDDYEDWDDMDDEPEEDSSGFTIDDRYNPEDFETE
jgi:hypothetical protein